MEFLARGYKHDAMATSWLPSACREDEVSVAFDHAGLSPIDGWTYYTDQAGSGTYTIEEVSMWALNRENGG